MIIAGSETHRPSEALLRVADHVNLQNPQGNKSQEQGHGSPGSQTETWRLKEASHKGDALSALHTCNQFPPQYETWVASGHSRLEGRWLPLVLIIHWSIHSFIHKKYLMRVPGSGKSPGGGHGNQHANMLIRSPSWCVIHSQAHL